MERPLFGGAITCKIPKQWRDVSDIRQVPDHQECYQDITTTTTGAGRLLVIEILEYQKDVSNDNAAAYFFNDLAIANGTTIMDRNFIRLNNNNNLSEINMAMTSLSSSSLPKNSFLCFGIGYQRVAMGKDVDIAGNPRQQEIQWIKVELCLLRLPSVETDLLITLSTPSETNPQEEVGGGGGGGGNIQSMLSEAFQQIITSFHIRDWSLFG